MTRYDLLLGKKPKDGLSNSNNPKTGLPEGAWKCVDPWNPNEIIYDGTLIHSALSGIKILKHDPV